METAQETEQTQDTECMQQIRQELHHAERRLEGLQKQHDELGRMLDSVMATNIKIEDTLARTSLKSKNRRKAIRQLEQALRTERLRHGYIVPEDMTPAQGELMHMGIAHYAALQKKAEQESDSE